MAAAIKYRASSMTAVMHGTYGHCREKSFSQSAGIRHCAADADDTDASEEADAALLSDAVADDASAEVLSEPVFCSVT